MKVILKICIVVILVCVTVMVVTTVAFENAHERYERMKCQFNLQQFGKSFNIYLLDIGKQKFYPNKDGQGFLLALYREKILIETEVYLCNKTNDKNSAEELQNAPDIGDAEGPVSYAGRRNANQSLYPGIFLANTDVQTTPIVSDDIGEPHNNHENGEVFNFLFLDGHVEGKRTDDVSFPDLSVLTN